jgi:hypothetical protein
MCNFVREEAYHLSGTLKVPHLGHTHDYIKCFCLLWYFFPGQFRRLQASSRAYINPKFTLNQ